MAIPAISDSHFSRVRFVALGALRDLAVYTVTPGTVQGSMLTLVLPELRNLPFMACETGIRDIIRK